MINLFTIFTFHMNFWRAHGNYILKITLCPFLKKIVILRLCQVAPYLTYYWPEMGYCDGSIFLFLHVLIKFKLILSPLLITSFCFFHVWLHIHLVNLSGVVEKMPVLSLTLHNIYCIRTEYGNLGSKSPYSVSTQENTDHTKPLFWTHFTQCLC